MAKRRIIRQVDGCHSEFRILIKVLKKHKAPLEHLCLGYQEESVCFEMMGGKTIVYYGERGNKYEKKSFDNIDNAYLEVINRLATDKKQLKTMLYEYICNRKTDIKRYLIRKNLTESKDLNLIYDNLLKHQIEFLDSEIESLNIQFRKDRKNFTLRQTILYLERKRSNIISERKEFSLVLK